MGLTENSDLLLDAKKNYGAFGAVLVAHKCSFHCHHSRKNES